MMFSKPVTNLQRANSLKSYMPHDTKISPEDRVAAINLILQHNSYLETVKSSHQARKCDKQSLRPKDACQAAVVPLF